MRRRSSSSLQRLCKTVNGDASKHLRIAGWCRGRLRHRTLPQPDLALVLARGNTRLTRLQNSFCQTIRTDITVLFVHVFSLWLLLLLLSLYILYSLNGSGNEAVNGDLRIGGLLQILRNELARHAREHIVQLLHLPEPVRLRLTRPATMGCDSRGHARAHGRRAGRRNRARPRTRSLAAKSPSSSSQSGTSDASRSLPRVEAQQAQLEQQQQRERPERERLVLQ